MKLVFIVPMFNAAPHIEELVKSLQAQKNTNWEAVIIDDLSDDDTIFMTNHVIGSDERFKFIVNKEKKYALKNVVENAVNVAREKDCIIAILDGDDALCNENTVDLLMKAYEDNEVDTVWTMHTWDINGMNISKPLKTFLF